MTVVTKYQQWTNIYETPKGFIPENLQPTPLQEGDDGDWADDVPAAAAYVGCHTIVAAGGHHGAPEAGAAADPLQPPARRGQPGAMGLSNSLN